MYETKGMRRPNMPFTVTRSVQVNSKTWTAANISAASALLSILIDIKLEYFKTWASWCWSARPKTHPSCLAAIDEKIAWKKSAIVLDISSNLAKQRTLFFSYFASLVSLFSCPTTVVSEFTTWDAVENPKLRSGCQAVAIYALLARRNTNSDLSTFLWPLPAGADDQPLNKYRLNFWDWFQHLWAWSWNYLKILKWICSKNALPTWTRAKKKHLISGTCIFICLSSFLISLEACEFPCTSTRQLQKTFYLLFTGIDQGFQDCGRGPQSFFLVCTTPATSSLWKTVQRSVDTWQKPR